MQGPARGPPCGRSFSRIRRRANRVSGLPSCAGRFRVRIRKKPRRWRGWCRESPRILTDLGHVCSLWSFLALHDFEFDFIAFSERLETASPDRAEMNEHVRSAFPRDEAKSFGVVEPFDRSSDACH